MEIQTLFWNAKTEDLADGYYYNEEEKQYVCLICGEVFDDDEVFQIGDRFFNNHKKVKHHIQEVHQGILSQLLSLNKSYTSLSDNQKDVITLMSQGLTDFEIASNLGLSSSTIRNYRFKFKEKEKQAKVFLAIMANIHKGSDKKAEPIITPHKGAKQIDERYNITEKDIIKTLEHYFDEHGKLITFPSKEKKKIIILRELAKNYKAGKIYSEKEINRILERIYEDYVLLRRYLIQYGFLDRNKTGSEYWSNSDK